MRAGIVGLALAGLEVVPHEQLAALPDFQKLKDAGPASPVEDEKFIGHGGWAFSPRGLPVVWDSDDEESFMQSSRDPDPRGEQYRSGGSLLGSNSNSNSASASTEYRLNADPARYEAEVLAAARATFAGFGAVLKARRNPS